MLVNCEPIFDEQDASNTDETTMQENSPIPIALPIMDQEDGRSGASEGGGNTPITSSELEMLMYKKALTGVMPSRSTMAIANGGEAMPLLEEEQPLVGTAHPSNAKYEGIPLSGILYVRFLAVFVMIFGVIDLAVSFGVVYVSGANYMGGLFPGIIGICGGYILLNPRVVNSRRGMAWMTLYAAVGLLAGLVGLAISSMNYKVVSSLKACTIKSYGGYGSSEYFSSAAYCFRQLDNNYSFSCVTAEHSCHTYHYKSYAESFLSSVPNHLAVGIAFLVLLNVAFIGLFVAAFWSRYHPHRIVAAANYINPMLTSEYWMEKVNKFYDHMTQCPPVDALEYNSMV